MKKKKTMCEKHVLVPWDRYQTLLALEKKDSSSEHASGEEKQSTERHHASTEGSTEQKPEKVNQLDSGGGSTEQSGPATSQTGSGTVQETKQEDTRNFMLQPPGIPARSSAKWLVW